MPKYAEIIPYKKLPKNIHYFDYKIPEEMVSELKIGNIVNIFSNNS